MIENVQRSFGSMEKMDAELVAMRFLEQQHDVHTIKVVSFENGVWFLEGDVSSSSGQCIRKLRIDDKNGKIIAIE